MRQLFPEFYRPSEEEFLSLWSSATVVLDASVLLNLYEYSQSTVKQTFDVLQVLRDAGRLWLPHQAAMEYQRGRPAAIVTQETQQYDIAHETLTKLKKLADDLHQKLGQHAYLDRDETAGVIHEACKAFEDHLRSAREALPDFRERDDIRDMLDVLYDGLVGAPWPEERLVEVEKQGRARYEREVPPGYADKEKAPQLRYGDLILWLQVLEYASDRSLDIIVVTDDLKEDWWARPRNRVFGPRPELRAEFSKTVGKSFYLYSHDRFLRWASEYLKVEVAQDSIDEIRDVRRIRERGDWLRLVGRMRTTPDFTSAIERLATASASVDLGDLTKAIGTVNFPDFPNVSATLNVPDYSRLLKQMSKLSELNWAGGDAPNDDTEDNTDDRGDDGDDEDGPLVPV